MSLEALKKDLDHLYAGLRIPLYLYNENELLSAWPEKGILFPPPPVYLTKARLKDYSSPFIPTAFSGQYGLLELPEDCHLVVGPVSPLPYTRSDLHIMYREYHVAEEKQEEFQILFHSIPRYMPRGFADLLSMIHHFLNPDSPLNMELTPDNQISDQILAHSLENVYEQELASEFNDSLEVEAFLVEIVEKGQVERLAELSDARFISNPGTLAQTPLRSEKNLQVALITVITRAAIRGGLGDQLALQLSDQFIQRIEMATSPHELSQLSSDAILCFTTQVARRQKNHDVSGDMSPILDYVRKHLNSPLTVSSMAETFGYTPSYLSTLFRKELGFGLSSFIYRTRLEAARELLTYTNKSILEISEHFCFSDQSHFQRKFKEQYGITPLQYRMQSRH